MAETTEIISLALAEYAGRIWKKYFLGTPEYQSNPVNIRHDA